MSNIVLNKNISDKIPGVSYYGNNRRARTSNSNDDKFQIAQLDSNVLVPEIIEVDFSNYEKEEKNKFSLSRIKADLPLCSELSVGDKDYIDIPTAIVAFRSLRNQLQYCSKAA